MVDTLTGPQDIGLIGVGLMGHGIAANLLKAGHHLTLLHHPGNQPIDDLVAAGAAVRDTPAAVAAGSRVVVLCVTGAAEVDAVVAGTDGVGMGVDRGDVVIDCSTSVPAVTRRIAADLALRGVVFADAAMTRTPKEAAEGRLNLIVGGTPEVFDAIRPVLACFAEVITHAGPVGAGHEMKLLHNYVSLGFSAVLADAAAAARRAGIAPEVFLDVVGQGGGGGVVFDRLAPYIRSGDASGFRFSLGNAAKDTGYLREMLADMNSGSQLSDTIARVYADAAHNGDAHRPVPVLVDLLSGHD